MTASIQYHDILYHIQINNYRKLESSNDIQWVSNVWYNPMVTLGYFDQPYETSDKSYCTVLLEILKYGADNYKSFYHLLGIPWF